MWHAHVAQGAAAEVEPGPPVVRGVGAVERAPRRGPEPAVPVQQLGRCLWRHRVRHALIRPDGPVRPDMGLFGLADGPAPDHFAQVADAVAAVALVAHLRHDAHLRRGVLEQARFGHGVRQRLLHVDVLAEFHRHVGRGGVGVVRGGDGAGVYLVAHLVEHVAVVAVHLGVLETLHGRPGAVPVHVAQGHDVLVAALGDVAAALAARADARDVELLVRRDLAGDDLGVVWRGGGARQRHGSGSGGRGEKRAPR